MKKPLQKNRVDCRKTTIESGLFLQCKNVDMLSKELDLPTSQLLGLFNTLIRKTSAALRGVHEKSIEKTLSVVKSTPLSTSANGTLMPLDEELEEAAKELKKKQKEDLNQLKHLDLTSYQVMGFSTWY